MTEADYAGGEAYLNRNYSFILPAENYTVGNILSTAEELVRRRGIKILVIDPFNCFEHQISNGHPKGEVQALGMDLQLDDLRIYNLIPDGLHSGIRSHLTANTPGFG
ncbi:MAG: hypothetical protein LBG18_00830 [Mediterranea sp.]|jgi:twinkle protein|nr:hypothetical protein [Mediterranea sp.]